MFKYMYITDSPEISEYVESCGVNRIFVDLERNGKVARQGHLNTVISEHNPSNIRAIKSRLKSADLMVRLNPFYSGSRDEVDMAIDNGCDALMLPMFDTVETIVQFGEIVGGRAKIIPLIETIGAAESIREISKLDCVDELHIGLNDLHLQMRLRFMFELISNGVVEDVIKKCCKPIGFGGIAKVGGGVVPAELVMAEHVRLNSNGVILSRAFHNSAKTLKELHEKIDFYTELKKLKDLRGSLLVSPRYHLENLHEQLCSRIHKVVTA